MDLVWKVPLVNWKYYRSNRFCQFICTKMINATSTGIFFVCTWFMLLCVYLKCSLLYFVAFYCYFTRLPCGSPSSLFIRTGRDADKLLAGASTALHVEARCCFLEKVGGSKIFGGELQRIQPRSPQENRQNCRHQMSHFEARYTKFDFGCYSTTDPAGEAYSAPQTP